MQNPGVQAGASRNQLSGWLLLKITAAGLVSQAKLLWLRVGHDA
jgi:hypothetical protein